jgi:outer membrane protein TolC
MSWRCCADARRALKPAETQSVLSAENAPVPHLELTSAPAAPADLLRLRPDVARAEAQTLIAAAQLGAARADLLPRLISPVRSMSPTR